MTIDFKTFLRDLPKCEHHVHLEGTLSPELLFKLAERNNISLPHSFPVSPKALHDRYDEFTGLDDFLQFYYIGMKTLISQQDFENLAYQYFETAYSDGVLHAEVFFDPQAHLERGITLDTVVSGFSQAITRAQADFSGFSAKLIMCLLRHLPAQSGVETVKLAKPYFESGQLCGIGLDSSEKDMNPAKFRTIYDTAKQLSVPGIRYTAHAGEEGPSGYVSEALDVLGVERIDHGVRSVEDPALLSRLAESRTLLTVCPLSNLKLRVTDDIAKVPLRKLLAANVPFSINSDDPAYFGGYILDNYLVVQEKFGFDMETWYKICENGILGSWIDASRKNDLLGALDKVRQQYAVRA